MKSKITLTNALWMDFGMRPQNDSNPKILLFFYKFLLFTISLRFIYISWLSLVLNEFRNWKFLCCIKIWIFYLRLVAVYLLEINIYFLFSSQNGLTWLDTLIFFILCMNNNININKTSCRGNNSSYVKLNHATPASSTRVAFDITNCSIKRA